MWLCCPPGRKTLRPVFSRRGSVANWVSYVHKCVRCASFQTKIQFSMLFFYTVVAECNKKMPPINAFCINCYISIKPQSVDAFCTKNFSLMQNASTLPTHFVTKNQNVPIVVTLVQNALYYRYETTNLKISKTVCTYTCTGTFSYPCCMQK